MSSKFWDDLNGDAYDPVLGPALRRAYAEMHEALPTVEALSADLRAAGPVTATEVWHRLEDLELVESDSLRRGFEDYRTGRVVPA